MKDYEYIEFSQTSHVSSFGTGWESNHHTYLEKLNQLVSIFASQMNGKKCNVQWAEQESSKGVLIRTRKTSFPTVFEIRIAGGNIFSAKRQTYRVNFPVEAAVAELVFFPLLLRIEQALNRAKVRIAGDYLNVICSAYSTPESVEQLQSNVNAKVINPRELAQILSADTSTCSGKKVRPPQGCNPLIWAASLSDERPLRRYLDNLWASFMKHETTDKSGLISRDTLRRLGRDESETDEMVDRAIDRLVNNGFLDQWGKDQILYVRPIPTPQNRLPAILTGESIFLIASLFGESAVSLPNQTCQLCKFWRNKIDMLSKHVISVHLDSATGWSDLYEYLLRNHFIGQHEAGITLVDCEAMYYETERLMDAFEGHEVSLHKSTLDASVLQRLQKTHPETFQEYWEDLATLEIVKVGVNALNEEEKELRRRLLEIDEQKSALAAQGTACKQRMRK